GLFQTYSSAVFTTSITLVVAFGIIHGLIVLPAFLINLPEWLTRNQCCRASRTRTGAGHDKGAEEKPSE
ncbi:hypothetical protein OSTOST_21291, partial [Ostertagia ostertagi]